MNNMLYYHIKTGYRSLTNSQVFAGINIVGMAIALATCLVLFTYVQKEFRFDKYVKDGDKTYRIISRVGNGNFWVSTFMCFADALENVTDVKDLTSFQMVTSGSISNGDKIVPVVDVVVVDFNFIDFFAVNMLMGNSKDIDIPNSIFITPEIVQNLFTNENPIGQTVSLSLLGDKIGVYTVKGVVAPLPNESHFSFEILVSQKGDMQERYNGPSNMKVFANHIYLKLHSNKSKNKVEESLIKLAEPYLGSSHGPPLDAFDVRLQPLHSIHFTQGLNKEQREGTSKASVVVLLIIGLIILMLAIVNFINLYIAQSLQRLKKASVFKIHGAKSFGMMLLTFPEILLMLLLSFMLSLIMLSIASPTISLLFSDWDFSLASWQFLLQGFLILILLALTTSILTGIFYARKPIAKLIASGDSPKLSSFRKSSALVVVQFAVVIVLLVAMIVINKQISYVSNKDLGYNPENIIVASFPSRSIEADVVFEELMKIPGVVSASAVRHHPTYPFQNYSFLSSNNVEFPFNARWIDKNALETLDIKILQTFTDIENGWVINKTFYNNLLTEFSHDDIADSNFPQNKNTDDTSQRFVISAVMDDFHYASLHSPIDNFAFKITPPENRFLMIDYHPAQTEAVVTEVSHLMEKLYEGLVFDYFFLDQSIDNAYASDRQLGRLIKIFSAIATSIALMGLFGLSLILSTRRTKEIGIRKVNGAKIWQVMLMLNLDFVKWVAIAFVIATPIAYFAMDKWLQNFAYRTPLSWWVFALAGLLALVIALLTVSWQSWLAARRNPVEALRYE
jgi:putative ABC transport system permease protein